MNQKQIISAFCELGKQLNDCLHNENSCSKLNFAIEKSCAQNEWFTKNNIRQSIAAIATQMLDEQKLTDWILQYNFFEPQPKRVGIIAAGNLPLVFFHDFLCVLISGNIAVLKPSSKDKFLPQYIIDTLIEVEPQLAKRIEITENKQPNIEAVIATGSDNTLKFFEENFGAIPHIFRNSRTSTAIIKGDETPEQLQLLGNDMFLYFGLGCRNVNKLFVPQNYNFDVLIDCVKPCAQIKNNTAYANAYRYNKALLHINKKTFIDNDFWLLAENNNFFSPVSVVNYEKYSNLDAVKNLLLEHQKQIQCAVNIDVDFGSTQNPRLNDYADGVDVIEFLQTQTKQKH